MAGERTEGSILMPGASHNQCTRQTREEVWRVSWRSVALGALAIGLLGATATPSKAQQPERNAAKVVDARRHHPPATAGKMSMVSPLRMIVSTPSGR